MNATQIINCTLCPEPYTSSRQETPSTGSLLAINTLLPSTPLVVIIFTIAIAYLRLHRTKNMQQEFSFNENLDVYEDVTDAEMQLVASVPTAENGSESTSSGLPNILKMPKSMLGKNHRFSEFYKRKMTNETPAYLNEEVPKMKSEKTKYKPEEVRVLIREHILSNNIFTMKKARESIVKLPRNDALRIKVFTNAKGW